MPIVRQQRFRPNLELRISVQVPLEPATALAIAFSIERIETPAELKIANSHNFLHWVCHDLQSELERTLISNDGRQSE